MFTTASPCLTLPIFPTPSQMYGFFFNYYCYIGMYVYSKQPLESIIPYYKRPRV